MRPFRHIKGFVYFVEDDCLKTGLNYLIKYPQLIYPMVGYKGRVLGVVKLSSLIHAVSTVQSHATPLKMYVYGDYPVIPASLKKERFVEIFRKEPFLWSVEMSEKKEFAGVVLGSKLLIEGISAGKFGFRETSKYSNLLGEEFLKILKILQEGQISSVFKKFLMIASFKAFHFKEIYPYLNLSSFEEEIINLSLKLNNGQKAELAKIAGFKRSSLYNKLKGLVEEGEEA